MIIGISGKIGAGKDLVGRIIQILTMQQDSLDKGNITEEIINQKIWHVPDFEIKKFANKLKDITCILIGCTREQLENQKFKSTPLGEKWIRYGFADGFEIRGSNRTMINKTCSKEKYEEEVKANCRTAYKHELTPRDILQMLGTQCARDIIHYDIWVNALFADYTTDPHHNSTTKWKGSRWIITDMRFPNELKAIKDRGGISIRINREYKYGDLSHIPNTVNKIINKEHPSETALDNSKFDYTINNDGTIDDLIVKVKEILVKENLITIPVK